MDTKKMAVIFPGIGYVKGRPLIDKPIKYLSEQGYDVIYIEYHDLPKKVRGDLTMMKTAAEMALSQAKEQLAKVDFASYDRCVFVGKSIGTYVAARIAAEYDLDVEHVWYTPLEHTFGFDSKHVIAFIGDADPWSDLEEVKRLAEEMGVDLSIYPDCNHSLETDDPKINAEIISDVMEKTKAYLEK